MAAREPAVGTVVWHEHLSTDPARARSFYGELLGWEFETWKPGELDYAMIAASGATHGGFSALQGDVRPGWLAAVLVEDVDETAAKAEGAGGTVASRGEHPEIGRWATIADPQRAAVSAYSPSGEATPPTGTFLWDELLATDVEPARRFYGEVFGWGSADWSIGSVGRYALLTSGGAGRVAGLAQKPPAVPGAATWVAYLAADDVDERVATAKDLGATAIMEAYDVEGLGRVAMLVDPTGALFGLLKPGDEPIL
jgi:predicted enzyme related to lactoylglutathione lyase